MFLLGEKNFNKNAVPKSSQGEGSRLSVKRRIFALFVVYSIGRKRGFPSGNLLREIDDIIRLWENYFKQVLHWSTKIGHVEMKN